DRSRPNRPGRDEQVVPRAPRKRGATGRGRGRGRAVERRTRTGPRPQGDGRATGPRAHGDGPARPRRGAVGDRARLPARGRLGGPSRREGPQSGAGMRLGGWQQRAGAGWVAHGPGPRFPLLPVLGRAEDKYHPWGDGITEPPVAWWQGSTRPSSEVMGSNPTGGGSTMFYFISLHFALGWTRHRARAGVAPRASCALGARRLGKSPIGSQLKPRTHA